MSQPIFYRKYVIQPYHQNLMVVVHDDIKKADLWVARRFRTKQTEDAEYSSGLAYQLANQERGLRQFIICIEPRTGIKAIAHESVHIAMFVLECVGISAMTDNSEPLTYLVEEIMEMVEKTITQYEKKQEKDKST